MAEIFISHSGHDRDLVDFFSRVGASTKVRLIFEEFEKIVSGKITAETIKEHIARANTVFVLLSANVQGIPHTRDWVLSEAGVAANKDLWVFEQRRDQGRVSIVTPFLRHYVVFEPNDAWYGYVRSIIESYDDSHVLGTVLAATGIGALFGGKNGAIAGAAAGLVISDRSGIRPQGLQLKCDACSSVYNVHLPQGQFQFRCPACNQVLGIRSSQQNTNPISP